MYKPIASLVDRVTLLGASELLLRPAEISLANYVDPVSFDHGDGGAFRKLVVGAILERQILSLHSSLHKPSIRVVVKVLLRDALDAYKGVVAPIRQAGIMVLCLDVWYHGLEGIFDGMAPESVGQKAEELLNREVMPYTALFTC